MLGAPKQNGVSGTRGIPNRRLGTRGNEGDERRGAFLLVRGSFSRTTIKAKKSPPCAAGNVGYFIPRKMPLVTSNDPEKSLRNWFSKGDGGEKTTTSSQFFVPKRPLHFEKLLRVVIDGRR